MCGTCATLLRRFGMICAQGQQRTTKGETLQPFVMSYTILQYSTVLPFTFATFSNLLWHFQTFATFLDFALFNTPPDCIAFSGTFYQTLFTWLVHHSFGFSCIISGQSALHFTNVSHFRLLLQLYLCFLLPPLSNRTESFPFDRTTVYWPQISLRLSSSSFSLAFLVYHTDHCRLFWNFVALSLRTYRLLERHFLTIFGSLIIISTHSFFPLSTARDRLPFPRTFSLILWCL